MSRDMATVDNAQGLVPYDNILRASYYVVETQPVLNFFHNSPVHMAGGGTAILTPHMGYRPAVADDNIIASGESLLGSVLATFDENMNPIKYMAATRVGNATIAGYLLVADHPQQRWVIQEDADGNAIDLTEGVSNVDLIAGTINAGNTVTGVSTCELNSDTAAETYSLMMRIIHPHEDDTPANDAYWCRYVVMANVHMYGNEGLLAETDTG